MYEKNFKFIIYLNLSILLTIFLIKTVNDQTASPHAETATPASGKARARASCRFRGV